MRCFSLLALLFAAANALTVSQPVDVDYNSTPATFASGDIDRLDIDERTDTSSLEVVLPRTNFTTNEIERRIERHMRRGPSPGPTQEICSKRYQGANIEWIITIPPEWWQEKFHNNAWVACKDWMPHFQRSFRGYFLTEYRCFEMSPVEAALARENNVHLLAGPGWLRIKFNSPAGVPIKRATRVLTEHRDPQGYLANPIRVGCTKGGRLKYAWSFDYWAAGEEGELHASGA
ncbi:hypothetical protein UCREL1_6462 [Eutypa lata UCREL1]|uniref:Uncharacterized protein n=1 Tax=Eutypa lata (strain UCR-EL1) TaxID=1287681 RepID=M7SJP5_EUTLA|nr:hypothetical protein UCREL1_6462 [Eutypa lata UCREL1]